MYMLFASSSVVFIYIFMRLIYPLKMKPGYKLFAATLLLLISAKQPIIHYFFGGLAAPELPREAIIISGWLFGALIILFGLVLVRDLFQLAIWLIGKASRRSLLYPAISSRRGVAITMVSAALLLGVYGTWEAIRAPDVKTMEVLLPNLPPELDGLNLVQISDLHASELLPAAWLKEVIAKANALRPDLILLTGDMIDGPTGRRTDETTLFSELKAVYGVMACVGNHEYISGFHGWVSAFRAQGLTLLNNEMTIVEVNGYPLVIAGVTDPAAERPSFSLSGPDVTSALKGAPMESFKILLAHQPREADQNARAGVDLQLSGHTHGAQMLGFGLIGAKMNNGFIKGWYEVGGMKLYVSKGAGLWNGFPIRLGVPSEITQMILRRAPSE